MQNFTFTVSGESLTSRMRSLLFKSMLRQDIGWFDDVRNNTAALTNRLSYDANEVQGVRKKQLAFCHCCMLHVNLMFMTLYSLIPGSFDHCL